MSLNPFSVKYLRPEVELVYLLRMRRDYRHKSPRKSTKSRCLAPKMAATLQENGCAEVKYDVRFKTGSSLSLVIWSKLRMRSEKSPKWAKTASEVIVPSCYTHSVYSYQLQSQHQLLFLYPLHPHVCSLLPKQSKQRGLQRRSLAPQR